MKLKFLLSALVLFFTTHVSAQTGRKVTGVIRDSTGTALPMATVKWFTGKDSTVVIADADGRFTLPRATADRFSLVVSSVGYESVERWYHLPPGDNPAELEPIILKNDNIILQGVSVTPITAVRIKEDTVEYSVAAYQVSQGAVIEEAIRKMPGLEVSKDGDITAQGKPVSKVQLNGKDYMAGDVKSLTRNLPADVVRNVQVIDDHGEQARLTGIKTGAANKVLNINIRKDRNHGYTGQATVGGGRDAMNEANGISNRGRYTASTNLFIFQGSRQITLSGGLNNTNTGLLDFSAQGRKGPPDLLGDGQNGIITTRSLGFNYRDDWSKTVTAYGSYSLARNATNTISKTVRDNLSEQLPSIQNSHSTRNDRVLDHRVDLNIEYKPDTLNYFKFIPVFSFSETRTNEDLASRLQARNTGSALISAYTGKILSHSSATNLGLSVLYNHRFRKHGRNISVWVTGGTASDNRYANPVYNYLEGSANAPMNQMIHSNNRTDSAGVSLSYQEPIGKISFLEFNYNHQYAHTNGERLTDTVTGAGDVIRDPDLSNDYNFKFVTSQLGLSYRIIDKKYNVTLGLVAQPTLLEGSSPTLAATHKKIVNYSPVVRYSYNFSDLQALSFNYRGASSSPNYNELQPVVDFSNANYPVQGNPNLLPEYNNSFQLTYNKFGDGTGKTFFTSLNFTQTNHKIVANRVAYPGNYIPDPKLAGTILTKYQNASGFYNASAYYAFIRPWANRKYALSLNGNISYNNNISYLTAILDPLGTNQTIRKNIAKNLVLAQGVRFRVDIPDVADAELSTQYSINRSGNSVAEVNLGSNFQTISLGTNGKVYISRNWTWCYNYSKVIYKGYEGAPNPNLLNMYLEHRFLNNNLGTLRFSVYDLFNENTGFSSTQNAYAITQSNVNRLGRYYLLTFTLSLQKFAGKAPVGVPGQDNGG